MDETQEKSDHCPIGAAMTLINTTAQFTLSRQFRKSNLRRSPHSETAPPSADDTSRTTALALTMRVSPPRVP
jgi:hypothetical protein